MSKTSSHPSHLLTEIARHYLDLATLETKPAGSQDHHSLAVGSIHEALFAAFEAGRMVGQAEIAEKNTKMQSIRVKIGIESAKTAKVKAARLTQPL